MLHQQAVDEDVSATHSAQEDAIYAIIEEGDETEGKIVLFGNKKTQ